tara:strand:- start:642 stop:1019 length:378 start_codon:yes stop_codon:yes gene_type:complete
MNNKTIIGVTIFFIISIISYITFSSLSFNNFGESFVEQIRIADSENTLENYSDDTLIQVGKEICTSSNQWVDEQTSLNVIFNLLNDNEIKVDINNRIIPILRFQSTYELCPENISVLEDLFTNAK